LLDNSLDALKAKLQWPAPLTTLPVWTMEEVKRRADQGQAVTVIDGVVWLHLLLDLSESRITLRCWCMQSIIESIS